jgi:hypothetical protein
MMHCNINAAAAAAIFPRRPRALVSRINGMTRRFGARKNKHQGAA